MGAAGEARLPVRGGLPDELVGVLVVEVELGLGVGVQKHRSLLAKVRPW